MIEQRWQKLAGTLRREDMFGKVRGNHYRIQSQLVCEEGGGQDQKLPENQNRQHSSESLSPFGY